MTTRMLQICAKNAAQASMRRRSGEDKVARKKKIMDSMHAKELARKHARARKIRHDRINGEVKDQDLAAFLKRVKLNNQANIGNPNRLKRVNHYPDPRNRYEKKAAKKKFKEEMKDAVKSAKHSLPTHKVASDVPESNYYVMKKEGVKTNEWAMLNMFSAEKSEIEAKKKEAARRKHAIEIQKYLRKQEEDKYAERKKEQEDKKYWLNYEKEQKKKWVQEQKKVKMESLKKHQLIQVERKKQLEETKRRTDAARRQKHREEMEIVRRQKKAIEDEKEEKRRDILRKQKQLEIVKKENAQILIMREKQKKQMWEEEARIDAQWKEILDKQERAREKRLADLYARQHKLVAIGKKTQNNEAAELAAEEARNKRHRDAEAKRRDDKEKAAIAKKERMKREMMASIDNAIIRKREEQETLMKKNREIGIKMNKIAAAKLKLQDEEVKKRLRNKKIYRRDLIRQISEDNARKAKARAAMDEVERNINASFIQEVKSSYEKTGRWMKMPKAKTNYKLSQVPL